ncbi:hypothetical protein CLV51_1134 [Chitinophaga niastensis]|uniref:Uncharacterized protein n=1 Tax=Chitinophaga niastensis TaxID=536980 RepID=A0A2P8H818_CHINA|nr:hypothetical protein [Chitinophaga niastensis]PSL42366.1 hypothetical protein CLV51_1134 [Chitinophaga niastensis]
MKKRYWITSLLLLVSCLAFGQSADNTESKDSTNIYYQALSYYCSRLSSEHLQTLLLEENNITTESIPRHMGAYNIEVLDVFKVQNRLKKKNSLMLIRIVPLRIKNGKFFINIIPFNVVNTATGVNYINSGGSTVEFLYDCSNKKLNVLAVKTSGI